MQSIRSFFLTVTGIALVAMLALLTASLTLAFAGILSALMIGRAMSLRLKPVPVRAKNAKPASRIWNDGRGTIIDM